MAAEPSSAAAFADSIDLAAATLGGRALICSDDFFASMSNLVAAGRGVFDPSTYTDRGKEMDGWESRRKRVPGHDWCIVQLGVRGEIRGVDVDTNHFLGNHPPFASLDACAVDGDVTPEQLRDDVEWTEILPQVPLQRGSQNLFAVRRSADASGRPWTHVRLHIYPDGGVARLKVYGEPRPVLKDDAVVDLASTSNGGRAVAASDVFFSPMVNLTLPTRAPNMGNGWETRRRREPGNDWIVVRLAAPGVLERLVIDTHHFKGNYPDRCAVEGICWPDAGPRDLVRSDGWVPVLPSTKMKADFAHEFPDLLARGPFTHLRLHAIPCGGVSRFRVFGRPRATSPDDPVVVRLNEASPDDAVAMLTRCCGSTRWVKAMVAGRPYASRAHLFGAADVAWWRLGDKDWLEAFTHHPRIGADVAKLREKYATTADWSAGEQKGVAGASEATLQALADGNREYERRFGHIFIVCATGKSADEMLGLLRERLDNEPANELRIAAGEQAKITRIRLEKLGDA